MAIGLKIDVKEIELSVDQLLGRSKVGKIPVKAVDILLHHKHSGIAGTVDAEVIHPDASVLVRISDRGFEARELVAA